MPMSGQYAAKWAAARLAFSYWAGETGDGLRENPGKRGNCGYGDIYVVTWRW